MLDRRAFLVGTTAAVASAALPIGAGILTGPPVGEYGMVAMMQAMQREMNSVSGINLEFIARAKIAENRFAASFFKQKCGLSLAELANGR